MDITNTYMKEKVILIGSGQHCNVVMYNIEAQGKYDVACIADVNKDKWGTVINGIKVVPFENFSTKAMDSLEREFGTKKFFISFGTMKYRKAVFEFLVTNGWEAVNVIHPTAVISPWAKIGKGVLIEAGCMVTPQPVIGDNVVMNCGSQVNHDNVVEDHVFIASGVVLSGAVRIGENALLDDGVVVSIGKNVGAGSIVGAGSVVTRNVPPRVIAYGVPCRVVRANDKY